jgi:hypothetical protein
VSEVDREQPILASALTSLPAHELHEEVERVLHLKQAALNADVSAIALDNAHAVAFHTGLGSSLYPATSTPVQKYLNEEYIASYADVVYSKPNIAVVADGAAPDALSKWVGQFFKGVPAAPRSGQALKTEASKYYGGEQRTSHTSGNSIVIAFPGSSYDSAKAEIAVLASLLGGQSSIKWSAGFSLLSKATAGTGVSISTSNLAYSDAGLLAVQVSGTAASVRKGAEETVKALKSIAEGIVAKEDVTKAIANAKFAALDASQTSQSSLLLAGSGLVNSGKVYETASLAKALDGVTAEKLQTVRYPVTPLLEYNTDMFFRPPRPFLMARPLFLPWVTSSCCLMLRSSVFGYRGSKRRKSLYQQSESSRRGGGDVLFVNICSRNPLVQFMCPLSPNQRRQCCVFSRLVVRHVGVFA